MVPGRVVRALIALALFCAVPKTAAAQPIVRLEGGYGAPHKWYGGGGLLVPLDRGWIGNVQDDWFVGTDVIVGQGGWKAGAGLGRLFAVDTDAAGVVASTLALRGVFARTWGSPRGIEADRSLVGAEVHYSLMLLVNLNAGVMYPLGRGPTKGPVFTWGVGIGLPFGS